LIRKNKRMNIKKIMANVFNISLRCIPCRDDVNQCSLSCLIFHQVIHWPKCIFRVESTATINRSVNTAIYFCNYSKGFCHVYSPDNLFSSVFVPYYGINLTGFNVVPLRISIQMLLNIPFYARYNYSRKLLSLYTIGIIDILIKYLLWIVLFLTIVAVTSFARVVGFIAAWCTMLIICCRIQSIIILFPAITRND